MLKISKKIIAPFLSYSIFLRGLFFMPHIVYIKIGLRSVSTYPSHSVRDGHSYKQRIGATSHRRFDQHDAHQTVGDEGHGYEQRRHDSVDGDGLTAAGKHERLDTVLTTTTHDARHRHVVRRTGDQSLRIIHKILVIFVIFIHNKPDTTDVSRLVQSRFTRYCNKRKNITKCFTKV